MSTGKAGGRVSGLVFSPWNLLLIIPLWVLITPLYNFEEPRLFGMPFFYWFQFAGIAVGVLCTSTVFLMTKSKPTTKPDTVQPDVDELDEGSAR
ncbi:DUF3311 domain-containing protein [Amycolatopsis albispora]|uniref:DUF3311 domain-containing protein n=1 Tax=Amycolatopsis albispora TaxID=1804986 RepID=A0A344LE73_9PSEU|nr:DUF3311 domain-containing protein [Amycolatopsis albispora]AXB46347.1 hypothetical protein A4R43_31030 [Amycolatopsis albispora]